MIILIENIEYAEGAEARRSRQEKMQHLGGVANLLEGIQVAEQSSFKYLFIYMSTSALFRLSSSDSMRLIGHAGDIS